MTSIGANPPSASKRFYREVSLGHEGGAHRLLLDGRPAKTRRGNPIETTSMLLAEAIAAEWNGQSEKINLAAMPMTRFVSTAIDLGDEDRAAWRDAVLTFLKTDLVCYRNDDAAALAESQAAAWDPLLAWFAATTGAALLATSGLTVIDQPQGAIEAARQMLDTMPAEKLLAVKTAAEIAGSAVIGLALGAGAFDSATLFNASRVDEEFQAARWGRDEEAEMRARRLRSDFEDAARLLSVL